LYKFQNNYFWLACWEFIWHIHIVTSNVLTQVGFPKTADKRHNGFVMEWAYCMMFILWYGLPMLGSASHS